VVCHAGNGGKFKNPAPAGIFFVRLLAARA